MPTRETVHAWRPEVPGVREVFHARFRGHAYPPHTHDVWTVLIVDRGDIRYSLDGRRRGAAQSTVTVLPPHVVHDGQAGPAGAFVKRVVYLDDTYFSDGLVGHAVDLPTIDDAAVRRLVSDAHRDLHESGDALAAETHLVSAAHRLEALLRGRPSARPEPRPDIAEATRAILDDDLAQRVTLRDIGVRLGVSSAHVLRQFSAAFAITPHAYVIARRIDRARDLLLDGWPAVAVATEVGFHDQAHLTRHFARHIGTTPGRFARS